MPAILLGGNETAVPVARSLGRAGVPVHAIGGAADPVRRSRFCTSYTVVEPGPEATGRWLAWLRSPARPPGMVMPVSDDGLELVVRHRDDLTERGFSFPESRDETVMLTLDKVRAYAVADAGGVPRPWTAPEDADPLHMRVDAGRFPVGVKPVSTHRFRAVTGIHDKLLVAHDPAELEAALERTVGRGAEVFLTELVPGPGTTLSYITYRDADGRPLFELVIRKIRQEPADFGVGSYMRAEPHGEIVDLGRRFCDAARLVGPAMVEFKVDPRDGIAKLIECNHRISLQVALVGRSGIDLPLLIYRRGLGERDTPLPEPHYGERLWHPIPDLRTMRELRARGDITTAGWLRSLAHRQHFTVWSPSDPMPTLHSASRHAARLIRRRLTGTR